jgi:hypothetical protein
VDEALAALADEDRAAALKAVDYRWLGIGVRLGLERPDQARHLLEMIGARQADPAALREGDAGDLVRAGIPTSEDPGGSASVPVRSALLARAAALSPSERASFGPEATYGWVARLTRAEILQLGRVVQDMLASGSPRDIGRGFGLAWNAGVRLPRQELRPMFGEFAELEVAVAGVLVGHDLRAGEPAPQAQGLGALLGQLMPRTRPEESRAAAALETSGEPGRLGLIALWNVWMAVRYRSLIPRPTFEALVHPWETVVGRLPEP